jgi:2-oxo-4-hydroxy-4-carboxy-5-ureidoimidazoline decarboxylase
LNTEYLARHGFPFIICVRHYTREGIFAALERRIERATQEERDEALAQIASITRGRLVERLNAPD